MYNPYLVVPLLVWAITQFLKFVLAALSGRVDFRYLYASGGMPSVHSAVVTSLATTAFLVDGPRSSLFGITVILAAIVMYDSFGVRRASGEQASAINLILDSLDQDRIALAHPQRRLRELLGHKPLEVSVGAVLGFMLAGLFNASRLGALWQALTIQLPLRGIYVLAAISVLLILTAIIGRLRYLRAYRKVEVVRTAVRHYSSAIFVTGLLGLALAFLAYEKVATALWIVWPALLALAAIIVATWLTARYRPQLAPAIAANLEVAEKRKWFEGPNRNRRAAKERSKKRR